MREDTLSGQIRRQGTERDINISIHMYFLTNLDFFDRYKTRAVACRLGFKMAQLHVA